MIAKGEKITPTVEQCEKALIALRELQRSGTYIPQVSLEESGVRLVRSYVIACLSANRVIAPTEGTPEPAKEQMQENVRNLAKRVVGAVLECLGVDMLNDAELQSIVEVMRAAAEGEFDTKVVCDIFDARLNIA